MGKLTKWHNGAESREIVRAEGWCMVRRKGAAPYLIGEREWDSLPSAQLGAELDAQYNAALSQQAPE